MPYSYCTIGVIVLFILFIDLAFHHLPNWTAHVIYTLGTQLIANYRLS